MQHIEFEQTIPQVKVTHSDTLFQLCKHKKHVWLQRIAIGILGKLGCNASIERASYRRQVFSPNDFISGILEQHREVLGLIPRVGKCKILIGAVDFEEATGAESVRSMLSFDCEARIGQGSHVSIRGMRVTVIPWMKGVLVMPSN